MQQTQSPSWVILSLSLSLCLAALLLTFLLFLDKLQGLGFVFLPANLITRHLTCILPLSRLFCLLVEMTIRQFKRYHLWVQAGLQCTLMQVRPWHHGYFSFYINVYVKKQSKQLLINYFLKNQQPPLRTQLKQFKLSWKLRGP